MSTPSERRAHSQGKTVQDAIERYLTYKIQAEGSRTTMRSPLMGFSKFCWNELSIEDIGDLEPADVRRYSEDLYDRTKIDEEISASTAQTYFAYVRAFLSWCVRDQLLETNPADTTEAMDPLPEDDGKRKTQYWSEDEREQLINYVTKRVDMALEGTIRVDRETAFRDRAIVVMLDGTGARGAELFSDSKDEKRDGLRWSDVDFEERSIEVYGKSRDYETAPFPESVHDVLKRWRGLLDPPIDEWPVFPTGHYQSKRQELVESIDEETVSAALEGKGDVGKTEVLDRLHREHEVPPPSISKEGVRRLMKRLTKEAGIEPDGDYDYLTLHGARRALGRDLYASGLSEKAQEALRHQSIETTHEAYSDTKIESRDLDVFYGDVQALQSINIEIPASQVTAIIGPSGCGKSTFLRCINRMNDLVDTARIDGELLFEGKNIYEDDVDPVVLRRKIGMVFQEPNPFPKSIYDNIAYGLQTQGIEGDYDEIVEDALRRAALWDEVKNRLDESALSLSGGQQQRLCIARAIAVDPDVLLMDEPASALDPIATSQIEDLIDDLAKEYTVVIVTHNMQQAARISDKTAVFLTGGELVEFDATETIFENPANERVEDYITGKFG